MYRKLLLSIALLFACNDFLFAQCGSNVIMLDTIDMEGSIHCERTTEQYSATGKILSSVSETQDPLGSQWVEMKRVTYLYDSNDSLILRYLHYEPNITNKLENTYDGSGNLLTSVFSDSSGSGWHVVNADTNNYISNLLASRTHFANGQSYKLLFTYDSSGNTISTLFQGNSGSPWTDSLLINSAFDVNNKLINSYSLTWNGASWDSVKIATYHYNASSLPDSLLILEYSSGVWINDSLYTFYYGAMNRLTDKYYMFWNGSQWLFGQHDISDVDANGYPTHRDVMLAYYSPTLMWESLKGATETLYNQNGYLLYYFRDYPSITGGYDSSVWTYNNNYPMTMYHYHETMGKIYDITKRVYYYASVTGDNNICQGDTAFITVTNCNGGSIVWSTGETTNTIGVTTSGVYQATITVGGNTFLSVPYEVNWSNSVPSIQSSIDSSITLCAFDNLALFTPGQTAVQYQWYRNDTALAGQNSVVLGLHSYEIFSGSYYLVGVNGCGIDTSSNTIIDKLPMVPAPVISSSGPLSFCVGDSVILTSSQAYSYLWSPNNETTQSITASATGAYGVIVYDSLGCYNARSVNVVVHAYPNSNNHVVYNAGMLATNPVTSGIQWYYNGTMISGATQASCASVGAGDYFYSVTNSYGCTVYSDTIYVDPSQFSISAGPDEYVCQGGSTYFGVQNPYIGGTAQTYFWSPNTGIINLGNGRAQLLTASASQQYILTCTDGGGHIARDTVNVIVYPATPAQLYTTSTSFCSNTGATFRLPDPTAYVSSWIFNGDTVSAGSNFFNVKFTSTLQAIYTDSNGCHLTTEPDTIYFDPDPLRPLITASLGSDYCHTAQGDLWVESVSGSVYEWRRGNQILGTDTLLHFSGPGGYYIYVTDSNGCEDYSYVDIDMSTGIPSFTIGVLNYGECDSTAAIAPVIQNASYLWYHDNVATNDTDNIFMPISQGNFLCEMSTPDGCVSTAEINWIDPVTDTCVIDTIGNLLYFVGTNTGYNYYQWYLNGAPIAGAVNSSYLAVAPGIYTLRLDNSSMCNAYSDPVAITSACGVTISAASQIICNGACDGQLTANVTGTPPFQYQWNIGNTSQSVTGLCAGISYAVTITDGTMCSTVDSIIFGTDSVHFLYTTWPTSCIGCSNGGVRFDFMNGVAPYQISVIPVAGVITGDSITGLPAGIYQFCLTDAIGCMTCINDTIDEDPTSVRNAEGEKNVFVYPNPTNGKIIVNSRKSFKNENYFIQDMLGEIVVSGKFIGEQIKIDLSEFAPGIYFVRMNGELNKVIRVIKQ